MYRLHFAIVVIGLIALGAISISCGGSDAPVSAPGGGQGVPASGQATSGSSSNAIAINGAGATFPFPLYSRWFYDYAFVDPSVRFNYQAIGSGGGIQQITARTVDIGASDAILTDTQLQAAPGLQMFPSTAGGIVPSYNLTGDDGKPITATIKFPYTSLADIYLAKIVKWNDPVLAQANPDLKLPAKDIVLVHRSDGSGTTFAFTDYLSKVSDEWKTKVGNATSVKWPSGLGGKGNDGVAGTVAQNDGSLGYVELAYALQNKLTYGSVQNKAGNYVMPTTENVQNAMADFGTNMGDKLAISIADAPGTNSWPIATYTYMLFYMDMKECAKAQKIVGFFKWAQGPDGLKDEAALQYIPLPDAVKTQVLAKIDKITCNGKPL